ncbi:C40 family peptidase [Enterococcus ureasiticus]|uniref:peptidoglycan amidohydrolase family protein n=1 Tax=Enterococcus ureasiticus TaxID=903984 RepID=UPI001A8E6034|nr:peptidoglycan amidohydrolase family protein [Enterococcus ureasiticus]MBO0472232.1 C40 family peptidase [Enterococcus ureasiticus]
MASIEAMIKWMTDRKGKVVYSNARPWGGGNPPQYDCSSAVISALQAGGFVESNLNEGWTGSLHDSILPKIATKISRSECRKGDIFVAKYWDFYGHTGFFIDNNTIIHCNAGDMTINTTVADGRMGPDPIEYYRLNGVTEPPKDEKKGEITMQCLYAKGNAMYYFTGDKIKILTSPTQANILKLFIVITMVKICQFMTGVVRIQQQVF